MNEIRPHGHTFEAVGKLKEKTDLHDKYLIYRCNDGRLNNELTFGFKSSRRKAKIGEHMSRKNHILCTGRT